MTPPAASVPPGRSQYPLKANPREEPMAYTKAKIKDLVDGKIDRDTLHNMLSTPMDRERFQIYLEIRQEQVEWDDPIILPLGPKLYIVQRKSDKKWGIRSQAGHDFC